MIDWVIHISKHRILKAKARIWKLQQRPGIQYTIYKLVRRL